MEQGSGLLYDFLQASNQRATHFMIGLNILQNPALFTRASDTLKDDIAVHTWTHRHMSTLANPDLVAEFGWTMQIIHNSTVCSLPYALLISLIYLFYQGGRVPRYWRPPYGDMDNRVRAVAEQVFGLTAIMWNQE
jgi:peptidoglycan/xylan/chitin deacetylase (PgdA/CDA1 family)